MLTVYHAWRATARLASTVLAASAVNTSCSTKTSHTVGKAIQNSHLANNGWQSISVATACEHRPFFTNPQSTEQMWEPCRWLYSTEEEPLMCSDCGFSSFSKALECFVIASNVYQTCSVGNVLLTPRLETAHSLPIDAQISHQHPTPHMIGANVSKTVQQLANTAASSSSESSVSAEMSLAI